jgi:hypothetical protein
LTATQIRENTVYFPGWKILVDGTSVPIQFQDTHNRGVMTFYLEKGAHDVTVQFGETRLRIIADVISALGLFSLLVLAILRRKLWQN